MPRRGADAQPREHRATTSGRGRLPSSLRRFVAASLRATVPCLALLNASCEPYRIEYRDRPTFYQSALGDDLPERVRMPDGTVVVYRDRFAGGTVGGRERDDGAERFRIREEREDGSVVLRALLPEHVLANTMTCLRNHEYELLWEQMLAQRTRDAYAREGQGVEEFAAFFRRHRHDLAATVNRMIHGLPRHEVVSDNLGGGVTRLRFIPQVSGQFRFKSVTVASELGAMKLAMIE